MYAIWDPNMHTYTAHQKPLLRQFEACLKLPSQRINLLTRLRRCSSLAVVLWSHPDQTDGNGNYCLLGSQRAVKQGLYELSPKNVWHEPCLRHLKTRESEQKLFSRMLYRKVPVLKVGVRGPGGDQTSFFFASLCQIRKAFASVATRLEGPRVASPVPVITFGNRSPSVSCRKCQQSQGWDVSGSQFPQLSLLLDLGVSSSCRVSKVSTVTGMGRVGVAISATVVAFGGSSACRV